ncbi:MAG: restriction endonuclease [Sulfuritalea sp.]|nr:restriction endonuclease [Sulfuritalea sp.]
MVGSEFARWINPVLKALRELGGSARPREVVELVARNEHVTDEVLDQINPAGGQRFPNQVHWARFYLAEAGFIDRSRHGVWKLTDKGAATGPLDEHAIKAIIEEVIERSRNPKAASLTITLKRVETHTSVAPTVFPERADTNDSISSEDLAPEQEERDYRSRLLAILQSLPPAGFERLCQRLLREAGFEQVIVTGKSGDGGIDGHGILSLNAFVSFRVLFQCKRYVGSVSPSQVRDFRGAMQGRADKGLILTTGSFTSEARREASRDGAPPIELVDGEKLIELFAKLDLGLRPVTTYDIDESFFDEYRK